MSKIITITFGKDGERATREGWYILSYADPKGGRTSVGTQVKRPRWTAVTEAGPRSEEGPLPIWDSAAADLALMMQSRPEWPKFIQARAKGNHVRLSVPDGLERIVFSAEFNPDPDQRAPHEPNPPEMVIEEEAF